MVVGAMYRALGEGDDSIFARWLDPQADVGLGVGWAPDEFEAVGVPVGTGDSALKMPCGSSKRSGAPTR